MNIVVHYFRNQLYWLVVSAQIERKLWARLAAAEHTEQTWLADCSFTEYSEQILLLPNKTITATNYSVATKFTYRKHTLMLTT